MGRFLFMKNILLLPTNRRAVSSVGLEHYLDRVGVTGSNPVQPTSFKMKCITHMFQILPDSIKFVFDFQAIFTIVSLFTMR
jgi:hypothetical protein